MSCHNTRNPQPRNDPVNLETASLDDLVTHAATWERVLRKLGARAMPPQGMPHPTEADYVDVHRVARRLARSRVGVQGHVGRRATSLHRLNRTEYGNAVRDLLGLDVDVHALLPERRRQLRLRQHRRRR